MFTFFWMKSNKFQVLNKHVNCFTDFFYTGGHFTMREERQERKREEAMKTVVKRLEFIVIAAPSLKSSLKCDDK